MVCEYRNLRDKYRPEKIKVLLIGESPPPKRNDVCKFFYNSEDTSRNSICYRIATSCFKYPQLPWRQENKENFLLTFCSKGLFLVDLYEGDLSKIDSHKKEKELTKGAKALTDNIEDYNPDAIIVIKCTNNRYLKNAGFEDVWNRRTDLGFNETYHKARFPTPWFMDGEKSLPFALKRLKDLDIYH